ncbi:unnamed protein product [Owenia fusiformis]|uniref:Uncharacterized protein n=2 Tax=Owenia fusiformis TaxID=6347 RepID=A0A8J1XLH3_OWEFU|nr:unnamed protein product [Owenia fusiformis]
MGMSRMKFKIDPPSMEGPPEFLRTIRAQQNGLEFYPIFIVTMWISAIFLHQVPAALVGVLYIYARQNYFNGYIKDAKSRVGPFKMSVMALQLGLVMSLFGLLQMGLLNYAGVNLKMEAIRLYKSVGGPDLMS